jgi:hypothetical protein
MPGSHSLYSASRFEADMLCPGRRVMETGLPDRSSRYADEGTAAHEVLSLVLTERQPAAAYVGRLIDTDSGPVEVTAEMAEAVQTAADNIDVIVGDGMLLSEQRVCYADALGVAADLAWGTSDVIAARGDELQVHDYKHGQGVEVLADDNVQMKLYALGALAAINDTLGPFTTVRLVIHQPRIRQAPSEWTLTVEELETWGRGAARSAVCSMQNARQGEGYTATEWQQTFLRPGEKQCKFCRAKATCPALRAAVADTALAHDAATPEEFNEADLLTPVAHSDAAWLSASLAKADLIEDWCKAVRAEAERRLLAGESVPGFKVVQGKRGNRQWSDPKAAELLLRETFRLPVEKAFDLKLISPTTAEKLHKAGDIGPRQWPKAQTLIVQSDGKPHVAPATDPRPALDIRPVADEFTPIDAEPALA